MHRRSETGDVAYDDIVPFFFLIHSFWDPPPLSRLERERACGLEGPACVYFVRYEHSVRVHLTCCVCVCLVVHVREKACVCVCAIPESKSG